MNQDWYLIYIFIFWLCRAARDILVPRPRVEPLFPAVDAWSPNYWHRESPVDTPLLTKVYGLFRLLYFFFLTSCPFYAPESHSRDHISFTSLVLILTVSSTLILMTLTSLKSAVRYIVWCPMLEFCLMFSSWLDWGGGFWEEEHGDEDPFSSHHIEGVHVWTWFVTVAVSFDCQARK